MDANINERFLRLHEVVARVGLKKSTLYSRIANGTFPAPINLGALAVAWRESEISAWQAGCINKSRGEEK